MSEETILRELKNTINKYENKVYLTGETNVYLMAISCKNFIEEKIKENTQLKQQLKDKDEKISNLIKLLIEMVFDDIDYLGVYQELVARHLVKLGYIVKEDGYYKELESNKED